MWNGRGVRSRDAGGGAGSRRLPGHEIIDSPRAASRQDGDSETPFQGGWMCVMRGWGAWWKASIGRRSRDSSRTISLRSGIGRPMAGVGDDGRPRRPPGRDDPNGHLAGGAESAPVARRSANERVRELAALGAKRQTANQSDGPFPPSGRNFGKGFPLARE